MGGLYERPARVEDIKELFGIRGAAYGPKPASNSTSHDGDIMVVVHHNVVKLFLLLSGHVNV